MKRVVCLIAVLGLVTVAAAQDLRSEAVWTAVHNRYVSQMDVWFEDGDFPRCIQLLRIMHELDPADYETTTDLGWMLGNVEKKDEELALYKSYRLAYPDDPEAAYPEAQFYFLKREYDKVPPIIDPTLKGNPHPNSYRMLANSYEKLGKLDDAKRVWDVYLERFPDDLQAQSNRKRVIRKLEERK